MKKPHPPPVPLFASSFSLLANLNLLLQLSEHRSQTFYSRWSPDRRSEEAKAPPVRVREDMWAQRGPRGAHTSPHMCHDIQQREQHWGYFGKQEGKTNNSKRAILSAVGHTGQTRSRLLKRNLTSESVN